MAISVGALKVDMAADPSPLINALGQASGAFQKTEADANAFSSVLGGVGAVAGGVVTAGLAVVAAGLAGVSTAAGAALGAWKQLDDAADTLTLKVGATGTALDGLTTSVTAIYNSSAGLQSSMGAIASAMGQVQQITGATGATLEGVTAQFLYLQQAEGQAAGSTETFARAMQSWNVPAEQMSAELDKQYAAFQKTGIGAGELNQALVQFGGQLRQMGLNLNQAEGLLSGMYSAGINSEKALAALSTAAGKFAKDGVDMASGLRSAIDQIKNVESPVKAAQIAVDTFGARAGPALADAIRQGKVSLEGLSAQLGDTSGALKKAVEATMDFPEKIKLMGREIITALQPAGKAIADTLGKALDEAKPAIDRVTQSVGQMAMKIAPAIEGAFSGAKQFISPLISAAETLRPTIEQLGGAFGRLGDAVGKALGWDAGKALSGWNDAVVVAAAWTQVLTEKFTAFVDKVAGEVQPAVIVTGAVLGKIGDVLTNNVLPPLQTLVSPLSELNNNLTMLNPVTMALGGAMRALGTDLGNVDWTRASKAAQALYDSIVLVFSDIVKAANIGISSLKQILSGDIRGGIDGFKAGMADLVLDHENKWAAIQAHLRMSMINSQSALATGVDDWKITLGAGLDDMVQEAANAAAQIREHMRLIQLGTQLGNAGRGQLDVSMHPELATQVPAVSSVVSSINTAATNYSNIGKAAGAASSAAAGAKKSAEELAKASAETLKTIVESVEKMKEFIDKGYAALVEGDAAAQLTALSEALFALGRTFADQLAAASQGMSEEAVKAADLGGQAIGHAASALSSMVGLLPKMWDFSKTDAWAAVQSSPELFVQMAAVLIDMGRQFYEQMAAASAGVEENSVKAASLLAQGIQSASSAITSVISAVKGMWEMYASGLWDEVQANRALLLQMSQWLIDMGRDIFNQFAAAAAGVDENAVKAAGLLSQGIQSATSAIGATLKLVQDLLAASFDPSFLDALFGNARSQIMHMAAAIIDMGRLMFEQFAAAASGIQEKSVAAATLLSNGIKAASDGLKAAADSVRLLLDVAFDVSFVEAIGGVNGTGTRLQQWVLGVAGMLSNMARLLTETWGAAGIDLGSRVVAAATRLTDGVKQAADGLKSTGEAVALLLSLAFVPSTIDSIGGVYGTGTRIQAWVLAVASMLANMALLIVNEWGRIGDALGSAVVSSATRLSTGIKSAQEGIKSAADAVQGILDLETVIGRLPSGGALPGWLTLMTSFVGNIALIMANEWGRIGGALSAGATAGASALAAGVASVAGGAKSVVDALGSFLALQDIVGRLPSGAALPGWIALLSDFLGNIALIATNEWGRIGNALQAGAAAGADALSKGAASVAAGVASVVAALGTFLDAGDVLGRLPQGAALPAWITLLSDFLGNLALIMVTEWGRIGATLEAGATVAADDLAKGAQSVSTGVTAVLTALQSLLDSGKVLNALPVGGALPPWLVLVSDFLANIALIMTDEWGRIGAALDAGATVGAENLAKGAASVATAVKAVMDSLALLTGKEWAKVAAALPGGTALVSWLTDLSDYLANIALIMTDEWGRIGAALQQGAVDGAAALSSGIGSVSSALSATMDTLVKLSDWLKKPVTLTSAMLTAVDTLAVDAAALWVAMANALARLTPPTDVQADAVKAWTDVSDFTSQAIGMMDTLVKLSDWLKKPAALTDAMKTAAATLAVEWTQLWFAIATALAAITPPTEDQDANVKAWAGVADFTSQAVSMMDTLVKLSDWLKKPVDLTLAMRQAAGVLAVEWTQLWWSIWSALKAITPPTETQQANVKAWASVADFSSQAVGAMDTLVKLSDWLKKPVALTDDMLTAAATLATEWTQLWFAIRDALAVITPPTEDEQANVKAWAGVADFTSQALSMTDSIVKLSDWLKKPSELTNEMIAAAAGLAVDWTRLWWAIQQALDAITPPTELEQANVKAWSGVSDFTSQALSLIDTLPKLADFLAKPMVLTSNMQQAAGQLAQQWTQLWWTIQEVLANITPPTEAQEANVKAWAGVADFTGQALGMIDTLTKLSDFLKKPLALTGAMKNAAARLAVEYTELWKVIADALNEVAPPTDVQEAAVKAWASVSDAFGIIDKTLSTIKNLMEFYWTDKATTSGGTDIINKGLPAAAAVQSRVKAALGNAVMMMQEIVKAATDPALQADLTQAAQDATDALNKVAGNAFTVINGVLSTVKSLFEFGTSNGPGWVQQQGGNNIWSTGSFTPGIPSADAVKGKVDGLMAALKAIVDSVNAGATNINIGADPAALQEKLSTVEALVTSIANIVAKVQSIAGATGFTNFSMRIALAFDIPDINAELARLVVNPLHVPVMLDCAGGYGLSAAAAMTTNYNTTYNTANTTINQQVTGGVATATAQTALTMGALFGSSPV